MSHATPLPAALATRSLRVVRPRDATDIYRYPAAEFRRLAKAGLLLPLTHGYYAIPTTEWVGNRTWRPAIEAVALGIAQVDYGPNDTALSGVSAARALGAVPRAMAVGVVSVPARRQSLTTVAGEVVFWHRPVRELDLQRHDGDLARGWVTTPEQTILDLADRPKLGGISAATAVDAIAALAMRCDWELVLGLSRSQDRRAAYARARWVAEGLVADAPMPPTGRKVSSRGLEPVEPTARTPFGIADDPA